MRPYSCSSSNYGSGSGCWLCGSRCLLSGSRGSSSSSSGRILQRRQWSRLINHRRVLIDFGGSSNVVLAVVFEEVADTSGDATANLESPVVILLLFFDLPPNFNDSLNK